MVLTQHLARMPLLAICIGSEIITDNHRPSSLLLRYDSRPNEAERQTPTNDLQ